MVHNTNRINLKLYIQLKWIHAYTHTRLYILYIHTFVKAFVCKQLIGIHFIILVKYQFEMCHTGGDGSVSPLKNHIANEKLSREKKLSRYFSIRYAAVYYIWRWCGTRRRMRGYWLMYKHSVVSFFMPTQRNRFSFIYWYGEIVAVRRNHTASHRIIVGDKRYIHTYIHNILTHIYININRDQHWANDGSRGKESVDSKNNISKNRKWSEKSPDETIFTRIHFHFTK